MLRDQSVSIRTVDLTKLYKSGAADLVIFEDLNIEIAAGERLALVGESGAGKSTLLHLLGGLDRPTRGRILFSGEDITALRETELAVFRNRRIGFVWQTHYLLPEFTALENVMMPLLIGGISRSKAEDPAMTMLDEVGLKARAAHRAGELSGGEQQRVVLARALVRSPAVLLADEPTGNLDHATGERVAGLFDDLHAARGLTSVVATHNLEFAKRCDRILKLEQGHLFRLASQDSSQAADGGQGVVADLQRDGASGETARGKDGTHYV